MAMSARNRPRRNTRIAGSAGEAHGVSMSRLESRPSRAGLWEYVFFVDIEGHQQEHKSRESAAGIAANSGFSESARLVPSGN